MTRFLMSVAVVAMVAVSGTVMASGPKVQGHGPVVVTGKVSGGKVVHETVPPSKLFGSNYHLTHGVHFSHGYYFRGSEYRHFHYRHWNDLYRCWTFYYPGTRSWYYWSGSHGSFFPLSYAPTVAPNGALPSGIDTLPDQLPPDQTPPVPAPPAQMPPVEQ